MGNPNHLVQKLWNYCNILRDDGLSYGDYVEQLTFLLFLKMADEQSRPPFNKPSPIPKGKDWPALLAKDGDELEIHYRHTLEELGKRSGKKLWIYNLRTNLHFTLKENTLKRSDLDDFVACYFGAPSSGPARAGSEISAPGGKGKSTPHPGPLPGRGGESGGKGTTSRHNRVETERFKSFTYDELTKRDKVNLDIFWLKDDALEESANLPAPEIIAQEITDDLEAALEQFATIAEDLKG